MLTYLVKSSQIDHYDEHLKENADIEVIELEEGDIVLTRKEREALAMEFYNTYISYEKHLLFREVVKKLCRIIK